MMNEDQKPKSNNTENKKVTTKVKKESALRKRFRNDEVTDEERAQDWFHGRQ